jgi:hypothetical protein
MLASLDSCFAGRWLCFSFVTAVLRMFLRQSALVLWCRVASMTVLDLRNLFLRSSCKISAGVHYRDRCNFTEVRCRDTGQFEGVAEGELKEYELLLTLYFNSCRNDCSNGVSL